MDASGNVVRTIKEAMRQTYTAPAPTAQNQNQTTPPTISPFQNPQPALTPAPSCTQDTWSCFDWLECSTSSSQTRTCNKTFECPLADTPPPSTSQSCTPPAPSCQADIWSCSDWNSCSTSGNQTRSCTKTFDCSSVMTPTPSTSQSCTPPEPSVPLDVTDNYSPALVSVALENSTAVAGSILGIVMVTRDDKNETRGLTTIEFRAPDGAGTIQQYEGYNNWNSGPVLVSRVIGDGYVEDTWRRTIKVPSLSGLWRGYRVDFADIAGNSVQFMSTAGSCTNVGEI